MRERTFRRPSAREILEANHIELPSKIKEQFILNLIDREILVPVGHTYSEAVRSVEDLPEGKIALFPSKFRVPKGDSDLGIKSLSSLVKIDSQRVMRKVSKGDVPNRLTKSWLEENKIWPYTLTKTSMEFADIENPPIGPYWVGSDGHANATTWLRSATGVEMAVMKKEGEFQGEIIDKKPYGRNMRVKVASRTEEGEFYEFTLFKLPMHKRGDPKQFSDWINIGHNSPDPDASYRGLEHDKREFPIDVWSASTIFSFYMSMGFVKKGKWKKQFRINPFPIPTNREAIQFIDDLRLRSLILHRNEEGRLFLNPLNKTEIDEDIGARTKLRRYDNCWFHWGKKDLSYLYTPCS